MSTKIMDHIQFVHHSKKKIKETRLVEYEENYRCKNGAPNLIIHSGFLIHGAYAYTIKMFKLFQKRHWVV